MSKLGLTFAVIVAIFGAMVAPSLVVRAQSTTRFEYARLTPYDERTVAEGPDLSMWKTVKERTGYRASVAGIKGWACQEFKPTGSNDALRIALVHLGTDGWELVSATPEDGNLNTPALTYLFKRQTR